MSAIDVSFINNKVAADRLKVNIQKKKAPFIKRSLMASKLIASIFAILVKCTNFCRFL